MIQRQLAEETEFYQVAASFQLAPTQKSMLGQFMTPAPIAKFMASLFRRIPEHVRILDPGAGVGTLTAALADRLCSTTQRPKSLSFTCYEIDALLQSYLATTLFETKRSCSQT